MPARLLLLLAPPTFVVLWATGFVVARLVAPFAEPMTFLGLRFAAAAAILAAIAGLSRAPWPRGPRAWGAALLAGALIHGVYLGGVFWAIAQGLPAGVSALIAATQPLFTALLARPLLGERVPAARWLGIALGFCGVALVLVPRLAGAGAYPPAALAASFVSTLGITLGTVWWKRAGAGIDLRSGAAAQYAGAGLVAAAGAAAIGEPRLVPAPELLFGFAWSVLVLSIGAVGLLLLLIRHGAIVGVASLFFLVPPISTLIAFAAFGEAMTPLQIAGMVLAALGVGIASRA